MLHAPTRPLGFGGPLGRAAAPLDWPVVAGTERAASHLPLPDSVSTDVSAVPPPPSWWPRWADAAVVVLVALIAVGLRFWTRSPLWLDEALSANIADLPLGDIPDALRRDGHPPLYYVLLHGWMQIFGTSAVAVRALSGLFGLATFPLLWVAARRLGGRRAAVGAVLVLAVSPYAIRYSTETRMYALVMVLSLAAWLVADDALERPTPIRLGALALLTGTLLWTHYWAMWLLGAASAALLVRIWRARRSGRRAEQASAVAVLAALAVGGLLFLPWVPNLLYQSAHTGTPWALPVRPTEVVAQSLFDLGGGTTGEALLLAVALVVLVLLAAFGRAVDADHIDLDVRSRPEARPMLFLVGGTLAISVVFAYATSSTFATRYVAILVPFVLALAGLGLSRLAGGVAFRVVVAGILVLGAAGGARNGVTDRTQAEVAADQIIAGGRADDLVIACPDQLGPALSRVLPDTYETVTYPRFGPPELVDWVDYEDRLAVADPERFGRQALARGGDRTIWLLWSGAYRTHKGTCERVLNTLLQARPWGTNPVIDNGDDFFEHGALYEFPPQPPPGN